MNFCWSYGEQKKEHNGCIDLQWLKDNSYSMMKLKDLQKHCQPLPTAIVSLCFNIITNIKCNHAAKCKYGGLNYKHIQQTI